MQSNRMYDISTTALSWQSQHIYDVRSTLPQCNAKWQPRLTNCWQTNYCPHKVNKRCEKMVVSEITQTLTTNKLKPFFPLLQLVSVSCCYGNKHEYLVTQEQRQTQQQT